MTKSNFRFDRRLLFIYGFKIFEKGFVSWLQN
nr:MAG TPA: hypothetical protein [Caudoviricetes sp.]